MGAVVCVHRADDFSGVSCEDESYWSLCVMYREMIEIAAVSASERFVLPGLTS